VGDISDVCEGKLTGQSMDNIPLLTFASPHPEGENSQLKKGEEASQDYILRIGKKSPRKRELGFARTEALLKQTED